MSKNLNKLQRSVTGGLLMVAVSVPATAEARVNLNPSPVVPPLAAAPVDPPSAGSQTAFQWDDAGMGAAGTLVLLTCAGFARGGVRRRAAHRMSG
jgi:hypothetical protein